MGVAMTAKNKRRHELLQLQAALDLRGAGAGAGGGDGAGGGEPQGDVINSGVQGAARADPLDAAALIHAEWRLLGLQQQQQTGDEDDDLDNLQFALFDGDDHKADQFCDDINGGGAGGGGGGDAERDSAGISWQDRADRITFDVLHTCVVADGTTQAAISHNLWVWRSHLTRILGRAHPLPPLIPKDYQAAVTKLKGEVSNSYDRRDVCPGTEKDRLHYMYPEGDNKQTSCPICGHSRWKNPATRLPFEAAFFRSPQSWLRYTECNYGSLTLVRACSCLFRACLRLFERVRACLS
jgi:hypothetical protein